jgi:hypothetical protein
MQIVDNKVVRTGRVELPRLAALEPKSSGTLNHNTPYPDFAVLWPVDSIRKVPRICRSHGQVHGQIA